MLTPQCAKAAIVIAATMKGFQGQAPEGVLYAGLMGKIQNLTLEDFQNAVSLLVERNIVKKDGNLLSDATA